MFFSASQRLSCCFLFFLNENGRDNFESILTEQIWTEYCRSEIELHWLSQDDFVMFYTICPSTAPRRVFWFLSSPQYHEGRDLDETKFDRSLVRFPKALAAASVVVCCVSVFLLVKSSVFFSGKPQKKTGPLFFKKLLDIFLFFWQKVLSVFEPSFFRKTLKQLQNALLIPLLLLG